MPKRKAPEEKNGPNGTKKITVEDTKGLNGTTDLPPTNEPHKKIHAWSGAAGAAAFDFRSKLFQCKEKNSIDRNTKVTQ